MRGKGEKVLTPRKLVDKITDLPDNVIDIILSRMPLLDAVKTSILSTKWRFHWTRIETLALDENFFHCVLDLRQYGEVMVSAYVNIVRNIFLSHSGSIRTLVLHVPFFGDTPAPDIGQWILFVSRNGVQDLTIESTFCHVLKLPSSVFQCVELRHLRLSYLELELPPPGFSKYSYLLSLNLHCQSLSGDILRNLIMNCPVLERFWLEYVGIEAATAPFFLNAPSLKLLSVKFHNFIDFVLENTPNISALSLKEIGRVPRAEQMCQDIVGFFGAIPIVKDINLNGYVLEDWAQRNVLEWLPVPLENHFSLSVHCLNMCSLLQLHSMFCIIKSSPNLHTLNISMYVGCQYNQIQTISFYLTFKDHVWSLREVTVAGFVERKPWILFIKHILSRCPLLEKLYLKNSYFESSFESVAEIIRFPRASPQASPQAEIIFSKM